MCVHLLEHFDHSAAFAATMWSYLVVLLGFFKAFHEDMFPAHLQVRPGVWAMNKSYQVSGKRRERPFLMDGGSRFKDPIDENEKEVIGTEQIVIFDK